MSADLTGHEATVKPDAPEAPLDTDATTELIGQLGQYVPEVVQESKAGYKTTEFWLTIVISLLTVLNGVPLPDKYEGAVVAALAVAYTISRGVAKKGVANITPSAPL